MNDDLEKLDTLLEEITQEEKVGKKEMVTKTKAVPTWLLWAGLILIVLVMAAMAVLVIFNQKTKGNQVGAEQVNSNQEQVVLKGNGKLSLTADKTELKAGEEVRVKILVDTKNFDIVIASAVLTYDENLLDLKAVDENDSALAMAVRKEQSPGQVTIMRGAIGDADENDQDDGYNGSAGILATLIFKAKQAGTAELKFEPSESSLILDDGKGTGVKMELSELKLAIDPVK